MKDKEFQELIDQSLNETISEVDMKALEERMLQDPQARIHYLSSVGLHASLRRRFSSQQEEEGPILFPGQSIFTRKTVWAVAACLVLFFGLLIFQVSNRPFAEVAHVIGAYRADGVTYKTGNSGAWNPFLDSWVIETGFFKWGTGYGAGTCRIGGF